MNILKKYRLKEAFEPFLFLLLFGFLYFSDYEISQNLFLVFVFSAFLLLQVIQLFRQLRLLGDEKVVIINKPQYSYAILIVLVMPIVFYGDDDLEYSIIAFFICALALTVYFIKNRRQILVFKEHSILDYNTGVHKKLSQLSSFRIYENNVEFIFNKVEVLQINKHELSIPHWDVFVERMETYKQDAHG